MGIMDIVDDIFGDAQKSDAPVPLGPQWATDMRERLALAAEPSATQYVTSAGSPYTGELVAPLSDFQEQGLTDFGSYLDSPSPTSSSLYTGATQTLDDIFAQESGELSPAKQEYMDTYKQTLQRELADAKDRLAARTSATDQFSSGDRVAGEARMEERGFNTLAQELARMFMQQEQLRLNSVPAAEHLMAFGETADMERIRAALYGPGALPQQQRQTENTARYNEYIRQMAELGVPLKVAANISMYKPDYYQPTYGPTGFQQFTEGFGALFGGMGSSGSNNPPSTQFGGPGPTGSYAPASLYPEGYY
jgi:hypothetical protein